MQCNGAVFHVARQHPLGQRETQLAHATCHAPRCVLRAASLHPTHVDERTLQQELGQQLQLLLGQRTHGAITGHVTLERLLVLRGAEIPEQSRGQLEQIPTIAAVIEIDGNHAAVVLEQIVWHEIRVHEPVHFAASAVAHERAIDDRYGIVQDAPLIVFENGQVLPGSPERLPPEASFTVPVRPCESGRLLPGDRVLMDPRGDVTDDAIHVHETRVLERLGVLCVPQRSAVDPFEHVAQVRHAHRVARHFGNRLTLRRTDNRWSRDADV